MADSLRQSLEDALVANPDDLGAHHAYADYLTEQGDPRGEFIQVQLALEEVSRLAGERHELQHREQALLQQHAATWLGSLARFHGDWCGPDKPYHFQFARGWLSMVRTLPVPGPLLIAVANAPECKLLRRLEVVYDMRYHPFDFEPFVDGARKWLTAAERADDGAVYDCTIPSALFTPNLPNLRAFKIGFSDTEERLGHSTMVDPFDGCDAAELMQLLDACLRLEELYLNTSVADVAGLFALPALGKLRVLQYYFGVSHNEHNPAGAYPLRALAENATLGRLVDLRLHPGRDATIELNELESLLRSPHLPGLVRLQVHMTNFGNAGAAAIVRSGILKRLKALDIAFGNMTDAGATILAGCADLCNLEVLNVAQNALTQQGVAALMATGVRVIAEDQHAEDEEAYLYEVDLE